MAQFIALHNLPFQAADHLSDLVLSMFPDSLIAADFSSKHTRLSLLQWRIQGGILGSHGSPLSRLAIL